MKYKKTVHKATNSRKLTVMIYIINTSDFLHKRGYLTSIFRYHDEQRCMGERITVFPSPFSIYQID
jgi:hypothetical protein